MKIERKNFWGMDRNANWFKINIHEEHRPHQEIMLNLKNVQSMTIDHSAKTISIAMCNSEIYEIICEDLFSIIKRDVEHIFYYYR